MEEGGGVELGVELGGLRGWVLAGCGSSAHNVQCHLGFDITDRGP